MRHKRLIQIMLNTQDLLWVLSSYNALYGKRPAHLQKAQVTSYRHALQQPTDLLNIQRYRKESLETEVLNSSINKYENTLLLKVCHRSILPIRGFIVDGGGISVLVYCVTPFDKHKTFTTVLLLLVIADTTRVNTKGHPGSSLPTANRSL